LHNSKCCLEKANSNIGLGQGWLLRSQTSLARIQCDEGSPSSGSSGGQAQEAVEIARAAADATARRHTSNYVEARGTLIPATEYLTRAIHAAERQGILRGQLLSLVRRSYLANDRRPRSQSCTGGRSLYESWECFLHSQQRAVLQASSALSSSGKSDLRIHTQPLSTEVRLTYPSSRT